LALLAEADNVVISAQVLNEFYVTVARELKADIDAEAAGHMVRQLARLQCVPIDAQLVQLALRAGQRWQLSHWHSLVVEASRQSGCSRVPTKDLADGAAYDGLVIENPFR
jgi:predicted nucleic acid-binding protein